MDYASIYDGLIARSRSRRLSGYSEKHHIVPKCIGGESRRRNVVRLTAREHYVAHLLLVKIHKSEPKLAQALWYMTRCNGSVAGRDYRVTARSFERARLLAAEAHSSLMKGKSKSSDHRLKISAALRLKKNALGVKRTQEQNAARSVWMRGNKNSAGRVLSAETRRKMSESQKRRFESAQRGEP